MRRSTIRLSLALALALPAAAPARAELRGHGGPVRSLAVLSDGVTAVSGSFDQSAIVWDLAGDKAVQVLRFHDGAVNAVAALSDRRFLSAGEDGRIAIWAVGDTTPARTIAAHDGPIVGLAVSSDGRRVLSASWDGTARLTPLGGGEGRVLSGHAGNVNAVAFMPDGRPVTGGYDLTVRIWPLDEGDPLVVTLPSPVNAVAVAPDGEIVAGGADGVARILRGDGTVRAELEIGSGPITAIALAPDGRQIAAATIGGFVAVADWAAARALVSLVGPGTPVWSLAWRADGRTLLSGGGDRVIRRWNVATGEHFGPLVMARPATPAAAGGRGQEVFSACVACHTLAPGEGNRAGPTLHGVFGRRIATLPGYNFSEALTKLDIVWSADTIDKLFDIGPARFTPGTKMPEQRVPDADRKALVEFLESATR